LSRAQEAIAKFKLQQSRKDVLQEDNGDEYKGDIGNTEEPSVVSTDDDRRWRRPQPQTSAYHKAQFQSSFAHTIDDHYAEGASISEAERNPYLEESETDYSTASEIDNSSHHSVHVKVRERARAPLSQKRGLPPPRLTQQQLQQDEDEEQRQGAPPAPPTSYNMKSAAEMEAFLSPVKVEQGDGTHFESPHMAALAFDAAGEEGEGEEGGGGGRAYYDDEIPDHTTHKNSTRLFGIETATATGGGDEEDEVWSPGGTSSTRGLGREPSTGIVGLCADFAADCAAYLRDIECDELVPDCRSKTWNRLLCTAKGRGSMARPVLIMLQGGSFYFSDSRSWRGGMPLILLGLAMSFATEAFAGPHNSGPHYNSAIILMLMVGAGYEDWPARRMGPQIIVSLVAGLSFFMDVVTISLTPAPPPAWIRGLTVVQMLAKSFALYGFLMQAQGTLRARRYLWRRMRLFLPPLNEPRRLMKDVRGRMLALTWVHVICFSFYLGFFIASVTAYGYQVVMSSGRASVSLSMFLLFKSITTAALVVGLALDIDPVLFLAYFGCLGFNMRFVKDYTRSKREELGGWPYAFFFNSTRFGFFEFAKALDFAWGVVGWSTLSVSFGSVYGQLEASLRFVITMIYITLFFGDLWGALLTYSVHWLVRRHAVLEEHDALSDSDDSELDDLGIRGVGDHTPLTQESRRKAKKAQRKEYRRSLSDMYGDRERKGDSKKRVGEYDDDDDDDYSEGDSDGDMFGAYNSSGDDEGVAGGGGGSRHRSLRRRGGGGGDQLLRDDSGADEGNLGPWRTDRSSSTGQGRVRHGYGDLNTTNNDDDDYDDGDEDEDAVAEILSDDSEGTRKRKRKARRLAIKALLKGKGNDSSSGVGMGAEGEHSRQSGAGKGAVQRFKDSVARKNRGMAPGDSEREGYTSAGNDKYGDHYDDLVARQEAAEAEEEEEERQQQRQRGGDELGGVTFSDSEKGAVSGAGAFASSRSLSSPRKQLRNMGGIDSLFSGMHEPTEEDAFDSSVDLGTYSDPPHSPQQTPGKYNPAAEGAFTWEEAVDTPQALAGKREGYYASTYASPEEAQAAHEATVAAMETSFEGKEGAYDGEINDQEKEEGGEFDLSFELNPYEVTVNGGGFKEDYEEDEVGLNAEEEGDSGGVTSPIVQQFQREVARKAQGPVLHHHQQQQHRKFTLKPGSVVTSPPKDILLHEKGDGYGLDSQGLGDRLGALFPAEGKGGDGDATGGDRDSSKHHHIPSDKKGEKEEDERDYLESDTKTTTPYAGDDGDHKGMYTIKEDGDGDDHGEGDSEQPVKAESKQERAQREEREKEEEEDSDAPLSLDHAASIEPEAFASLYEVLSPACDFTAQIRPLITATGPNDQLGRVSDGQVTAHLHSVGFQVVATGPAPGYGQHSFRMFLFASGYRRQSQRSQQQGDTPLPIFCLCELSVRHQEGSGDWELDVHVKCTQKKHATGFVAELSLGNLFELL
jgi:hypothetical protein